MFHFSFPEIIRKNLSAFLSVFLITGMSVLAIDSHSVAGAGENTITAVTSDVSTAKITLRIQGSTPPAFTAYELFKPARIIVDIAEADTAADFTSALPKESHIKLTTRKLTDATPHLTRFEFTLQQSLPFKAVQENNAIVLTIDRKTEQASQPQTKGQTISKVDIQTTTNKTLVRVIAGGPLKDFSYNVLDKKGATPPRLYIDLNNVTGDNLLQEQKVGTSLAKIRVAKRGSGLRIVLDSSQQEMFPFKINPVDKGLEVVIDEPKAKDQLSSLISQKNSIESQLPQVNPLEKQLSPQATEQQMHDAFNFSGYNKERITVDFYKIDLHNVFRLFREVSGVNIVVDEEVSGSLTLALDDVPWDFALDIILNLQDLQKEERFNTLVILPKSKTLDWPKQAENNLSFETDSEVVQQEALLIRQQENLPPEVIEAKESVQKARQFEKHEDYETAIRLYEKAFTKWPDNSKLANKISSMYLVQLRQNAKAVYFAKKALEIEPDNKAASLNAAIGLANMQEKKAAIDFFDHSISAEQPSSEALLSYAVFSEEQKEYPGALKLLGKHDQIYGESLLSMIATARILDKKGEGGLATDKYQAILYSGYRLPPDLTKFIKSRIALKQSM